MITPRLSLCKLHRLSLGGLRALQIIVTMISMAIKKKKNITLDDLALMMGRGFNEVHEKIDKGFTDVRKEMRIGFADVNDRIDVNTADIQYLKSEVNSLKNGIDKFIMFYEKQKQEFTIMKDKIRRIKEILEIKLGVKI